MLTPPAVEGRERAPSVSTGCSKLTRDLSVLGILLMAETLSPSSLDLSRTKKAKSLESREISLGAKLSGRLDIRGMGGRTGGCRVTAPRVVPSLVCGLRRLSTLGRNGLDGSSKSKVKAKGLTRGEGAVPGVTVAVDAVVAEEAVGLCAPLRFLNISSFDGQHACGDRRSGQSGQHRLVLKSDVLTCRRSHSQLRLSLTLSPSFAESHACGDSASVDDQLSLNECVRCLLALHALSGPTHAIQVVSWPLRAKGAAICTRLFACTLVRGCCPCCLCIQEKLLWVANAAITVGRTRRRRRCSSPTTSRNDVVIVLVAVALVLPFWLVVDWCSVPRLLRNYTRRFHSNKIQEIQACARVLPANQQLDRTLWDGKLKKRMIS